MPKPGQLTESQIQRNIVTLLSGIAEQNKFMFFSVPNERFLSWMDRKQAAITMNKLKSMGLTPGVSDIVIAHADHAFFAEVKKPTGTQTENQKRFMRWCEATGCRYVIVRSIQDMLRALKDWEIIR